jgi:hypothetical protein
MAASPSVAASPNSLSDDTTINNNQQRFLEQGKMGIIGRKMGGGGGSPRLAKKEGKRMKRGEER